MSSDPDEPGARAGGGEPPGGARFDSTDEMIEFARDYFASDFPNPARENCPPAHVLSAIARERVRPDEELRAHLFGCSECFRAFREAVEMRPAMARAPWWRKILGALAPVASPRAAIAFSLLIVALIGIPLWLYLREARSPEVVRQQTPQLNREDPLLRPDEATNGETVPDATGGPTVESPTPSPSPTPRTGPEDSGSLVAMQTVRVDLQEHSILRGEEGEKGAIRLPRGRLRLDLLLPEGSPAGSYRLRVVGESEASLLTASARSADGRRLRVTLDTRTLAPRKYRLQLLREGSPPQNYELIVHD